MAPMWVAVSGRLRWDTSCLASSGGPHRPHVPQTKLQVQEEVPAGWGWVEQGQEGTHGYWKVLEQVLDREAP